MERSERLRWVIHCLGEKENNSSVGHLPGHLCAYYNWLIGWEGVKAQTYSNVSDCLEKSESLSSYLVVAVFQRRVEIA